MYWAYILILKNTYYLNMKGPWPPNHQTLGHIYKYKEEYKCKYKSI